MKSYSTFKVIYFLRISFWTSVNFFSRKNLHSCNKNVVLSTIILLF